MFKPAGGDVGDEQVEEEKRPCRQARGTVATWGPEKWQGGEAFSPTSARNSGDMGCLEQRRGQNIENDGELGVAAARAHATLGDTMFERQHLSFLIQCSKLMYVFFW